MSIVYTEREKCGGCYVCVRHCPAKAIRVRGNVAEVLEEQGDHLHHLVRSSR